MFCAKFVAQKRSEACKLLKQLEAVGSIDPEVPLLLLRQCGSWILENLATEVVVGYPGCPALTFLPSHWMTLAIPSSVVSMEGMWYCAIISSGTFFQTSANILAWGGAGFTNSPLTCPSCPSYMYTFKCLARSEHGSVFGSPCS